jgi:hypothetical protein
VPFAAVRRFGHASMLGADVSAAPSGLRHSPGF